MYRDNRWIAFSIFLVILISPVSPISVRAADWSRTLNQAIDILHESQRNKNRQDEEQRRRQQQDEEQRRLQQQYEEQRQRQQQYERKIHQQPLQRQYREEEAERIRYIQQMLNELQYDAGPPDGVMGVRTRSSIMAFQTDYNLEPDGNINATLVKELTAAVGNINGGASTEPLGIGVDQMVTDEKSSGSLTLIMGEEKRSKTAVQTLYRLVLQNLGEETCKLQMSQANTALSFARIMDHSKEAESFFTRYSGWNAEDEFARSSLQSEFYQQFVVPEINKAPRLPLNMVLVYSISLLEYDSNTGGFPLKYTDKRVGMSSSGSIISLPGINSVNLDIPVERPEVFSISQEKAVKFIHSIKNRRLYLKVDVTLNTIDSGNDGRLSIKGDVADIYIYADQYLTRLVQHVPLPVTPAPAIVDQNLRLEVGFGFSSGKNSDANKNLLNKTLTLIFLKTEGVNLSNSYEANKFAEAFLSRIQITKYFTPLKEWTGKNEFEKARTQEDFKNEVVGPLIATAPSLPLKIEVIYAMHLQNYDTVRGGFPLICSGKSKNNYFERINLLGGPEIWLSVLGTMPDFLALPEVEAESLISSLQRRNVFLKAEISLKRFRNSSLEGEIDRLAFYKDAGVERMIVELPPPTVIDYMMDRDIPDKIEPKGSVELTTDTLALLLLRSYPEKIKETSSWNLLAQARMRYEQSIHKKGGEWFDHDPWTPFYPFNYNKKELNDEEISGFLNWSKARAAGLSSHMIYRFKDEVWTTAGVPVPIFSSKKNDEKNTEGFRYPLPKGEELVLVTPCKVVKSSNLVLPSDLKVMDLTLSQEDLGAATAFVRFGVEVEIGEVKVTAGKSGCVIDVQGDPIAVEVSLHDRVIRRIAVDRQVRNTAIEALSRQEAEREAADKEKEAEKEQQKRAAYEQAKKELDILGIRLGISFADAEGIARQHLGQGVYVFTNPKHISTPTVQPLAILKNGNLFLNRDTGESIGIYGSSADGGEVIAVFRQMIFTEGIPLGAINDLLMEKYGSADSALNNGRGLSWSPVKENLERCSTSLTILGMNQWVSRDGEKVNRLRKSEFPKNSQLPGICPLTLDCGVRLKADIETISNSEKVRRLSLILIDSTRAVEISRQENERSEKKSLDNLPRL